MRTRRSFLNFITALTGQIISILAGIVARVIFTRYMSREYLGLSGLFTNILTMLSLVELGVGPAITFALYKPLAENDTETVKSLMRLFQRAYRTVGCLILLLGLVFTPLYPFFIKQTDIPRLDMIYWLYVLNTGVSYFYSYKIALITADQKQYIRHIGHYSAYVLMNVVQTVVLVITRNYLLYLICQVLFTVAENVILSTVADRMYPYLKDKNVRPLRDEERRPIMRNIRAMLFHKIGTLVVGSTDNLLLSKFLGLGVVGVYSNYSLIVEAIKKVLSRMYEAVTASVGNLNAEGDREKLYIVYGEMYFLSFSLYGFCTAGLMCLIQPFIELAFGREYLLDDLAVLAVCMSFYTSGMRQAPNVVRAAAGLYYRDWPKPIVESVVNLAASILLLKYLGVAGVFFGTVVSTVFVCTWVEARVVYKYALEKPFWLFLRDYAVYAVVVLGLVSACYAVSTRVTLPGIAGFAVRTIAVVGTYGALYLLLFWRDRHFRGLLAVAGGLLHWKRK